MEEFNIEKEFNKLIENGWLNKNEAYKFMNCEDILSAINCSTSPDKSNIFNALKKVPLNRVKIVILGQDPYPNPKHAHGYAFSSLDETTPDSLKNIFRAIDNTYNSNLLERKHNNLTPWVEQDVLLLNTSLTYQYNQDKKIQGTLQKDNLKTWKPFLNLIIQKILSVKDRKIVMLLWGNDAHSTVFRNIKNSNFKEHIHKRTAVIIPNTEVMILQSSHPSPLSVNRGGDFLTVAAKHFQECDKFLGKDKINWTNL